MDTALILKGQNNIQLENYALSTAWWKVLIILHYKIYIFMNFTPWLCDFEHQGKNR